MSLTPGTRIGVYEVIAQIGAGGMGEVYRARDARLGRDVAIKVLPDLAAMDPDRIARFQREAQLLASLNHPHIGAIYGIEESDAIRALVLELVDGPTLADRIASGPLEIDDAIAIARQIADALEAAHNQGVIHRDLKPANINITPEGRVKVLDFGLAKMLRDDTNSPSLTTSPTLTAHATLAGMILGTAAYMSPEQARGKPVDRRTDIWAFGCVLFEMLTGKGAFASGETVSDVVAAILKGEPAWHALPAATPLAIRRVLRRCLAKDPRDRLHDIGDARLELDDAHVLDAESTAPITIRTRRSWGIFAGLGFLAMAIAAILVWQSDPAPQESPVYRSVILPPPDDPAVTSAEARTGIPRFARGLALTPDGRRLALVAPGPDGRLMLWVRALESLVAKPLVGTEGAAFPFWSPDGRHIGFVAEGKLKRTEADGGPIFTLSETPVVSGAGTWNRDNVILFAAGGPILRVSSSGGIPSPVTSLTQGEVSHSAPFFLPDGKHFLFRVAAAAGGPGELYVGSVDSKERTKPIGAGANAKFANGFLVFTRETTLMAQRFDVNRLESIGEPTSVAEQVQNEGVGPSTGAFSVSESGVLVYQGGFTQDSRLVWLDRTGKDLGALNDAADFSYLNLAPNGRQVAVSVLDPSTRTRDIWLYDTARPVRTRFTSDPTDDFSGIWSPDGERLAYVARRAGDDSLNLYQKASNGSGEETRLLATPGLEIPVSWAVDGQFILYQTQAPNADLWMFPTSKDAKPVPFATTRFNEASGQFSPDGHWIAYSSNETGRTEVYVAPFQRAGGKVPISTGGGGSPRWRSDGRELFYVAGDNTLMAVALRSDAAGIEVGEIRPLFQTRFRNNAFPYDVTADGQRFVVNQSEEAATSSPITLVVNWTGAIQK